MEMPLELSSRAASSSSCSRRDLTAVALLRADAVPLIMSRYLIFDRAALRLGFRDPHRLSGDEFLERGADVVGAIKAVVKNVVIHGAFVGDLAVAVDDEKTRRGLGSIAASDAAIDIEEK